ncbi:MULTISPECIES: DUF3784 domain-containing protein [unclassified Treponema]|uniref:DUF3784 domain-containing protein n=1 Tax=unclassified Treponema TaxID=2638727 RepID=UPI0020A31950|nr:MULTISPECIES: DUF3784 domain-containing protein [unclassified Treponema]UTC67563.1 DUF3784 domain-containing protein [Treponema sp. OMZ 789]UTC70291.1 DUF3784 domain-containing protein [Treponema sp. OMZ 790]UTC73006.1 DUF3784 domain-containing protein [Treponema sp. OMZ 791]
MIGFYIIAAVLALLGILIHKFKLNFLIAGYNMMSKEEKKEYDASLIGKHVGLTLYLLSALSLAAGLFFQFFPSSKQTEKLVIVLYIILTMIAVSSLFIKENKKKLNEILPFVIFINLIVTVILAVVIFAG